MPAQLKISQVRIVLEEVRQDQGAIAVAALLRPFGATDADSIKPHDYPQVMQLCGHPELAGGTVICRSEEDNEEAPRRRAEPKPKAWKQSDFATVVHSAPTLKDGFDLAAKAIHSRPVK